MAGMEQAGYDITFREMVAPIAEELCAHDPRTERIADYYYLNGGKYSAQAKEIAELFREYWIDVSDHAATTIMALAANEHHDPYWNKQIDRAAQDRLVRTIIGWLLDTEPDDKMLIQDYHDHMEKHIVATYGLAPEMSAQVFKQCEDTLRQEKVHYGEA